MICLASNQLGIKLTEPEFNSLYLQPITVALHGCTLDEIPYLFTVGLFTILYLIGIGT